MNMWGMTNWYVRCDALICLASFIKTWLIEKVEYCVRRGDICASRDMTHWHVSHDLLICATKLCERTNVDWHRADVSHAYTRTHLVTHTHAHALAHYLQVHTHIHIHIHIHALIDIHKPLRSSLYYPHPHTHSRTHSHPDSHSNTHSLTRRHTQTTTRQPTTPTPISTAWPWSLRATTSKCAPTVSADTYSSPLLRTVSFFDGGNSRWQLVIT